MTVLDTRQFNEKLNISPVTRSRMTSFAGKPFINLKELEDLPMPTYLEGKIKAVVSAILENKRWMNPMDYLSNGTNRVFVYKLPKTKTCHLEQWEDEVVPNAEWVATINKGEFVSAIDFMDKCGYIVGADTAGIDLMPVLLEGSYDSVANGQRIYYHQDDIAEGFSELERGGNITTVFARLDYVPLGKKYEFFAVNIPILYKKIDHFPENDIHGNRIKYVRLSWNAVKKEWSIWTVQQGVLCEESVDIRGFFKRVRISAK